MIEESTRTVSHWSAPPAILCGKADPTRSTHKGVQGSRGWRATRAQQAEVDRSSDPCFPSLYLRVPLSRVGSAVHVLVPHRPPSGMFRVQPWQVSTLPILGSGYNVMVEFRPLSLRCLISPESLLNEWKLFEQMERKKERNDRVKVRVKIMFSLQSLHASITSPSSLHTT